MNIFVGNLSFKIKEHQLKEIFEEYGDVTSVKIITDRQTGRSKGFAFVIMDNDSDARKAIQEINGRVIDNRDVVVNEARPRN